MGSNVIGFPTQSLTAPTEVDGGLMHGPLKTGIILLNVATNQYCMIESYADITDDEYDCSYCFKVLDRSVANRRYKETLGLTHAKILTGEYLHVNASIGGATGRSESVVGTIYDSKIVEFVASGSCDQLLYTGKWFIGVDYDCVVNLLHRYGNQVELVMFDKRDFFKRLLTFSPAKATRSISITKLLTTYPLK